MSKYKIILVTLVIVIISLGSFAFVWLTGLISPIMSSITDSGWCASLGVERLSDHDLNQIQNNSETEIRFLQITEEEMKTLPKLKQVIDKVGNRVELNTHAWITLTPKQVQDYHEFLGERFEQQYGSKLEQEPFVFINYNNKTYVIDGFVFTTSTYDMQLFASLHQATPNSIKMTDQDFESIPKIKTAIDEIGTYETSPFSNIGLPEDEQRRYMDWFKEKFEEQYGTQEDGSYSSYFHYNGKYYAPNFSIC